VSSLPAWQVKETDGIVYVWYPKDGNPTWHIPPLPELVSNPEKYYPIVPYGTIEETVQYPPQFVAENLVDATHIKYVHGFAEAPSAVELGGTGVRFRSFLTGSFSGRDIRMELELWGLGYFTNRVYGSPRELIQIATVTPIDDRSSVTSLSIWVERATSEEKFENEPDGLAKALIRIQREEVFGANGDAPIWTNMRYQTRPVLVSEEAKGFTQMRRWARQFYTEVDER